jgi:hypothetical protein
VRTDAKQNFHFGVNFVVAPTPSITNSAFIGFQGALAKPERGLGFEQAVRKEDGSGIQLIRNNSPLQVTVQQVGPSVAQLLIIAPQPAQPLNDFINEAECVCEAFFESWPGEKTIVVRDGALRRLYPLAVGAGGHAFQFLWERRLHQADGAIQVFQRPILGGGIRLVFPPVGENGGPGFEVKIESFLQDPTQLFVETTAVWTKPLAAGELPDPRTIMETIQEFADGPVEQFILMES